MPKARKKKNSAFDFSLFFASFFSFNLNIFLIYCVFNLAFYTNSHYQVLEVEIVRLDLSVGQGAVKIEIENEV